MKAADRSTRNGDKTKWKNLAGKNRTCSIHELRQCGHVHFRPHDQDSGSEGKNRSGLDECAQVIARRKQQPDR